MDRLRRLEAFVEVADTSSFSSAARRLGLAQSQVSRAVRKLEEDVGAPLFTRTTRAVLLTPEGQRFVQNVRPALAALTDAAALVRAETTEPSGTLRVTAPIAFGDTLAPVLAFLVIRYPQLQIDSLLADRVVNIVEEDFDVAIRFGALARSTLRVRRLGTTESVLCASAAYLESRASPRRVADLADHELVLFTAKEGLNRLRLVDARGRDATVRVSGRLRTNDLRVVLLATREGAGIAPLPLPLVRDALASGELVRVLPTWSFPATPIHAVFPPRNPPLARVSVFVDAMIASLEAKRRPARPAIKDGRGPR